MENDNTEYRVEEFNLSGRRKYKKVLLTTDFQEATKLGRKMSLQNQDKGYRIMEIREITAFLPPVPANVIYLPPASLSL